MTDRQKHDALLYGSDATEGLVAVELKECPKERDQVVLFSRRNGKTVRQTSDVEPFLVTAPGLLDGAPVSGRETELSGQGPLKSLVRFDHWKDATKAKSWLAKTTGFSPSAPGAPYLFINDPVQQFLMLSGKTLFVGMPFDNVRRMQVDIECVTTEGFEFCNAEREGDRIVAIALSDQTGWVDVLSGQDMDEKALLERFVEIVRERDPDVLEGHNIFNFDLPYLATRAKRHGVKLALGRDGSAPRRRPSRFSVGERTVAYTRFNVFGRHIVDTLFLVHAYDISHRSLSGFGLKEVAVHFGLAAPDRTYVEGGEITREFAEHPDRVMAYVRDDVIETREVSNLLSRSSFIQARLLPYTYQNVCVRGNAMKIDALMIREYLRQGQALPMPDRGRQFAGGYTDMFEQGIVENVHHCDVRSLYPSLMLTRGLGPRSDELGVFLEMLEVLRDFRVDAKQKARQAKKAADQRHYDALQATFKVLINSFYGYLGFSQARFSDFDAAEQIAGQGRELLRFMITWLREHGARPVEIDTDGIYFVPPAPDNEEEQKAFRDAFADALPDGIEVEFDGEYRSMFSYKMKNYALLTTDGEMIIKGAALKSRGLEPFQRTFLEELLRLKLEEREQEIGELKARYEDAITNRKWPVQRLAKTETLQDSPANYAAKIAGSRRGRAAAYELALASGRDYRAGDQVSYYVTGKKKSVAVHEAAKLVSEWDPGQRDENVPYYLAKLEALYKKFAGASQAELGL